MALYELRTYTLYVGKMAEATRLYQRARLPALHKGGHDKKLIGYFQGDTGTINQLVHLWRLDDRRRPPRALGGGLRRRRLQRGLRVQVPAPGLRPRRRSC